MSPPGLAERLLARLLPAATWVEVREDLEELWRERVRTVGRGAANRWYWTQAIKAVLPSVRNRRDARRPRGGGMLASVRRDLRHGVTLIARQPGVSTVVIGTLALGIGTTTAIFTVVHAVLLKPLPFTEPSELVMITAEVGGSAEPRFVSGPDLMEMVPGIPSLSGVAGFVESTVGPLTEVERPEHVVTHRVTWNLFDVLGIPVALGRHFRLDDVPVVFDSLGLPTTPRAAIISHEFWQRSFGSDPGVLGRSVRIWGENTEIVGVLPAGFRLTAPPEFNLPANGDVWRVLQGDIARTWSRERRLVRVVGRLKEGRTVRQARMEADRFAASLREVHPNHAADETRFRVRSYERAVAAPIEGTLWVLMAAVSLVLLIACANVANLLLARGAVRRQEIAVRSALGAGRGRLIRQLLTETVVFTGVGALGGVLLAGIGVDLLHAIRPSDLHQLAAVSLNIPVLLFSVGAAVIVTFAAGVVPARHTAREGTTGRLRVRGLTGVARRTRATLVVVQVALSVVLVVGAGLLIRTFIELQRMPLGFEPERLLTVTATQPTRTMEARQAYEAALLRAVGEVPGVSGSGIAFPLPMNGVYERSAEYAVEVGSTDPAVWTTAYFRTISPSYFETMGLQLLRGRRFERADENRDVPVVILDQRLAEGEFPGADPVGQPFFVRGMTGDTLRAEIVGVVEYAPQWDHRDTRPTMYFPRVFYLSHEVSVVARVEGDPAAVAPALADAIRAVDPGFPSELVPMQDFVRDRLARSRFLLILMQIFGGLALGLSGVGLYGALSYSVRQRVRELGLRLALGADGPRLTRAVVQNGVRLAAIGVGVGSVGALAMGQALRAQLVGVNAADPWTIVVTGIVVLGVAATASLGPALRAARVDPLVALQQE